MTSADSTASHSNRWLFFAVLCVLLAACGSQTQPVKLSGQTMGTSWHVTYVPATATATDDEAIRARMEQLLERVNASMSTYREDSEIQRLNHAPVAQWISVSPEFYQVLGAGLEIGDASNGAYDVSVAPLVDLWGFGPGEPRFEAPSPQEIEATRARVGQQYLELDPQAPAVRKLRPLALDFSSIAKGYAVDVLALYLQSQQIANYLVEVGGEMRAAGHSPRGDKWRVAIEQPDGLHPGIAEAIVLGDAAVATSGDYRNYFEADGKRYSHSIDPRTGYPVAHDLVSVTVVASSAMRADGWATALTVLGAEPALALAKTQGLAVYFIRREGERFVATYTEAFSSYIDAGYETHQTGQ